MEEKIEKYLIEETGEESEVVRRRLMEKVLKYDDIAKDFVKWLETRNYGEMKVEVGGYTAGEIYTMAPMLDGIGVFNFLVTLRDNPEGAKKIIEEGFVVW